MKSSMIVLLALGSQLTSSKVLAEQQGCTNLSSGPYNPWPHANCAVATSTDLAAAQAFAADLLRAHLFGLDGVACDYCSETVQCPQILDFRPGSISSSATYNAATGEWTVEYCMNGNYGCICGDC